MIQSMLYLDNNFQVLKSDKRGKLGKQKTFNNEKVIEHIENLNPCISHYQRIHAPTDGIYLVILL